MAHPGQNLDARSQRTLIERWTYPAGTTVLVRCNDGSEEIMRTLGQPWMCGGTKAVIGVCGAGDVCAVVDLERVMAVDGVDAAPAAVLHGLQAQVRRLLAELAAAEARAENEAARATFHAELWRAAESTVHQLMAAIAERDARLEQRRQELEAMAAQLVWAQRARSVQ